MLVFWPLIAVNSKMDTGKNISTQYNLVYYIFLIYKPIIIVGLVIQAWIFSEIKYFWSKIEEKYQCIYIIKL